jgi:hypothetical protein
MRLLVRNRASDSTLADASSRPSVRSRFIKSEWGELLILCSIIVILNLVGLLVTLWNRPTAEQNLIRQMRADGYGDVRVIGWTPIRDACGRHGHIVLVPIAVGIKENAEVKATLCNRDLEIISIEPLPVRTQAAAARGGDL